MNSRRGKLKTRDVTMVIYHGFTTATEAAVVFPFLLWKKQGGLINDFQSFSL